MKNKRTKKMTSHQRDLLRAKWTRIYTEHTDQEARKRFRTPSWYEQCIESRN